MLKKLKFWVIRKVFNHYYSDFEYPFLIIEDKIRKMHSGKRRRYYQQISEFANSPACELEIGSLIQKFYRDLSIKPNTPENVAAYRLCLIFINKFEARMHSQSARGQLDRATDDVLEKT